MKLPALAACTLFGVAACGGGGGHTPGTPAPAARQSPGGIWHTLGESGNSITMLIAETGELNVIDIGPAFGSGAVIVNVRDEIMGSYDTRGILTSPTAAESVDSSCDLEGTVAERATIRAMLRCIDSDGAESTRDVAFVYNPIYDTGSSLADIAGNYTLPFTPQTNILNINGDGRIFGVLDNGPNCTVNGQVEIIDPSYNLYRFELGLSSCQLFTRFDGATFTGLAFLNAPGLPAGTFLMLVTSTIDGRLEFLSLAYEPV